MPILTCGPFHRIENDSGVYIRVPMQTFGDWRGTPEGCEALEKAQSAIQAAVRRGELTRDAVIEWKGLDDLVLEIPCASWADSEKAAPGIKALIPGITGAMVADRAIMRKQ